MTTLPQIPVRTVPDKYDYFTHLLRLLDAEEHTPPDRTVGEAARSLREIMDLYDAMVADKSCRDLVDDMVNEMEQLRRVITIAEAMRPETPGSVLRKSFRPVPL